MAPAHQGWIDGLMAGLTRAEMVLLLELLGKLKHSVQAAENISDLKLTDRRSGRAS
jgi:hypothetical protein